MLRAGGSIDDLCKRCPSLQVNFLGASGSFVAKRFGRFGGVRVQATTNLFKRDYLVVNEHDNLTSEQRRLIITPLQLTVGFLEE